MHTRFNILVATFLLLGSIVAWGQKIEYSTFTDSVDVAAPFSGSLNLTLNKNAYPTYANKQLVSAKMYLEVYTVVNPLPASGVFTQQIQLAGNASIYNDNSSSKNHTLAIQLNEPRVVYVNDFTSQFSNASLTTLTINTISQSNTLGGNPQPRVKLRYVLEYRLDVNDPSVVAVADKMSNLSAQLISGNRRVMTFSWNPGTNVIYPGYELQVLKLYNNDPAAVEPAMNARINWNKALNIHIESNLENSKSAGKVFFSLAMAEGTGLYVWRVRPVGNFYQNGFGNERNYASYWAGATGTSVNTTNMLTYTATGAFFFNDPDDDKNWMYTRVFSENNATNESISYADYLLRKRQIQVYVPSTRTTLTTQYVPDFQGRNAVTSLPIPIQNENELGGYKSAFMKDLATNELFRDKHFDSDARIDNPSLIKVKDQGGFEYYQNNPDPTIPNAEGHAYMRNVYDNFSNTRIVDQSMAGVDHAIGSGHTVRTLYSNASDDELIRIFGDEAPEGDKVMKATSIDQNGTASITYTDLTGKTIATCLGYNDTDHANSTDPMSDANNKFTVNEEVNNNVQTNEGIISTKRISFTQSTPLAIKYNIPCAGPIGLCGTLDNANCEYFLYVVIHDVKEPLNRLMAVKTINTSNCGQDVEFTPADFRYQETGHPRDPGSATALSLTFNSGDYIVEKRLVSNNANNDLIVQRSLANIQARVQGYIETITGKLKSVRTNQDFTAFLSNHNCLIATPTCTTDPITQKVTCTFTESGTGCSPAYIPVNGQVLTYMDPAYAPNQGIASRRMHIRSECCNFSVPIEFIPPIECPNPSAVQACIASNGGAGCPTGSDADVPYNYGFSKYAVDFLTARAQSNGLPPNHYTSLPNAWGGYSLKEIDKMIFHMLNDSYGANSTDVAKVHYNCDKLAKCWVNALNTFAEFKIEGDASVKGNNAPPEDELDFDDIFDNMPGGGLLKLFFGKKKKKKMKEEIDESIENATNGMDLSKLPSIVETFLKCAGPKYAKVFVEKVGNGPDAFAGTTCAENPQTLASHETSLYNADKLSFYRVYAFKYYPYLAGGLMPRNITCESGACFCPQLQEPIVCTNACSDVNEKRREKCVELYGANFNNTHWTFTQRKKFFACVSAGSGTPVNNNLNNDDDDYDVESDFYTCDDLQETTDDEKDAAAAGEGVVMYEDLLIELDKKENECTAACNMRKTMVVDEVRKMFIYNCYKVGSATGCSTAENYVPEKDIIAIAEQLIDQCKSMCDVRYIFGTTKYCNLCTENGALPRAYVDVTIGSPQENKLVDIVLNSKMELDIESKCTLADHPNYNASTGTGFNPDRRVPCTIQPQNCSCANAPDLPQCNKDYEFSELPAGVPLETQVRMKFCEAENFDPNQCPLTQLTDGKTQYYKLKVEVQD